MSGINNFSSLGHPGGVGRLQMAAGNDLEVYWKVYTQHNRGHIIEHMKPYKIGELTKEDMAIVTGTKAENSTLNKKQKEKCIVSIFEKK